jgi:hypothetical protein
VSERATRPLDLRLAVARRLDGVGDERLGQSARRQIRFDAEAARAARPERVRPLVCEARVPDPPELAAAGDGGGRRLATVADRQETRLQIGLRARPPPEEPRRDVQRRRRRPASVRTGRP